MEEDNTLDLMATHDFNTPINATVIFEESDEELSPFFDVTEATQNDNVLTVYRDASNNVRDTVQITSNELVSTNVENYKSTNDNLRYNLEKLDKFWLNIKPQSKPLNYQEAIKRKNENLSLYEQKRSKQYKGTCKENHNNNRNGLEDQHRQNKSKGRKDTVTISQENSEVIPNFIGHDILYTNQQQNDICVRAATCLKDLLNTVSDHLTFIMKLLLDYTEIYRDKTNHPNKVEYAKNQYYRSKYHLFHLSYSTVVNLIIPKEDDSIFLNDFLTSTIKLANIKGIQCSYLQVKLVFYEMIKWVKQKKMQIYSQSINTTTLTEKLKLQTLHQNPNCKPGVNTDINQTCIFSYGPPEKEVRINTIPTVNYQNRYLGYANYYPNNEPMQTPQNCYDNNNAHTQNARFINYQSYSFGDQRSCVMPQQINLTKSNYGYRNIPPLRCNSSQYSASGLWQHQDVTPRNTCVDNQIGNHVTTEQTTNHSESARSSVSRDSGFISPLNFNASNEQQITQVSQCYERVEEQQYSETTPQITHVTSLNPHVSYICNGPCNVCGKSTKTKCLGCYKYYYCSHECQILDWQAHMGKCKKDNAKS